MSALDAEVQSRSPPQAEAIVSDRVDGRAWLLLAALFLAYICSAADRAVISLIVEPIKTSLRLSDTQIGLLQGVAFLLVYSLAGVPAGMLADRVPRLRLASGAVVVWSFMTSLCGLARSFSALFAARAGVGIGESVLSPVAMSLIADRFPKSRQGLAIGIYVCGSVVGSALAIGFGGLLYAALLERGSVNVPYVGMLEPWQQTFILLGLPGIGIALLLSSFREPPRRVSIGFAASVLLPLAPGIASATGILGIVIFSGAVPFSVANAALQVLAPANIRGTVSAIYYLSISVIGALGPSAVALITDYGFEDPSRLNLSLTFVMAVTSLLAAVMYGLAIAPYKRATSVKV